MFIAGKTAGFAFGKNGLMLGSEQRHGGKRLTKMVLRR
jgi:hypothetical protein